MKPETIKIDDVEYVRKTDVSIGQKVDGLQCCMIRTYSAGVHFGYVKSRDGKEVILLNSRRVYYWDGAATLSQLAVDGTTSPKDCKFPCIVPEIILTEAIEIIPMTDKSIKSLYGVTVWEK